MLLGSIQSWPRAYLGYIDNMAINFQSFAGNNLSQLETPEVHASGYKRQVSAYEEMRDRVVDKIIAMYHVDLSDFTYRDLPAQQQHPTIPILAKELARLRLIKESHGVSAIAKKQVGELVVYSSAQVAVPVPECGDSTLLVDARGVDLDGSGYNTCPCTSESRESLDNNQFITNDDVYKPPYSTISASRLVTTAVSEPYLSIHSASPGAGSADIGLASPRIDTGGRASNTDSDVESLSTDSNESAGKDAQRLESTSTLITVVPASEEEQGASISDVTSKSEMLADLHSSGQMVHRDELHAHSCTLEKVVNVKGDHSHHVESLQVEREIQNEHENDVVIFKTTDNLSHNDLEVNNSECEDGSTQRSFQLITTQRLNELAAVVSLKIIENVVTHSAVRLGLVKDSNKTARKPIDIRSTLTDMDKSRWRPVGVKSTRQLNSNPSHTSCISEHVKRNFLQNGVVRSAVTLRDKRDKTEDENCCYSKTPDASVGPSNTKASNIKSRIPVLIPAARNVKQTLQISTVESCPRSPMKAATCSCHRFGQHHAGSRLISSSSFNSEQAASSAVTRTVNNRRFEVQEQMQSKLSSSNRSVNANSRKSLQQVSETSGRLSLTPFPNKSVSTSHTNPDSRQPWTTNTRSTSHLSATKKVATTHNVPGISSMKVISCTVNMEPKSPATCRPSILRQTMEVSGKKKVLSNKDTMTMDSHARTHEIVNNVPTMAISGEANVKMIDDHEMQKFSKTRASICLSPLSSDVNISDVKNIYSSPDVLFKKSSEPVVDSLIVNNGGQSTLEKSLGILSTTASDSSTSYQPCTKGNSLANKDSSVTNGKVRHSMTDVSSIFSDADKSSCSPVDRESVDHCNCKISHPACMNVNIKQDLPQNGGVASDVTLADKSMKVEKNCSCSPSEKPDVSVGPSNTKVSNTNSRIPVLIPKARDVDQAQQVSPKESRTRTPVKAASCHSHRFVQRQTGSIQISSSRFSTKQVITPKASRTISDRRFEAREHTQLKLSGRNTPTNVNTSDTQLKIVMKNCEQQQVSETRGRLSLTPFPSRSVSTSYGNAYSRQGWNMDTRSTSRLATSRKPAEARYLSTSRNAANMENESATVKSKLVDTFMLTSKSRKAPSNTQNTKESESLTKQLSSLTSIRYGEVASSRPTHTANMVSESPVCVTNDHLTNEVCNKEEVSLGYKDRIAKDSQAFTQEIVNTSNCNTTPISGKVNAINIDNHEIDELIKPQTSPILSHYSSDINISDDCTRCSSQDALSKESSELMLHSFMSNGSQSSLEKSHSILNATAIDSSTSYQPCVKGGMLTVEEVPVTISDLEKNDVAATAQRMLDIPAKENEQRIRQSPPCTRSSEIDIGSGVDESIAVVRPKEGNDVFQWTTYERRNFDDGRPSEITATAATYSLPTQDSQTRTSDIVHTAQENILCNLEVCHSEENLNLLRDMSKDSYTAELKSVNIANMQVDGTLMNDETAGAISNASGNVIGTGVTSDADAHLHAQSSVSNEGSDHSLASTDPDLRSIFFDSGILSEGEECLPACQTGALHRIESERGGGKGVEVCGNGEQVGGDALTPRNMVWVNINGDSLL